MAGVTPPAATAPAPGRLALWWRAARPYSLTAAVTPVVAGTAAAARDGHFDPFIFLAALGGAVAIQAGTNMVNDYYDFTRGVDTGASIGPGGLIQHGLLAPGAVLAGGLTLFAAGSALGLWLVTVAGWPVLVAGILSVLAGYAYTGGPLPLGYIGLGDLIVFIFMGPVIVLGAYFVQTRALGPSAWWVSLPVAALVTAVLVVNNLRDLDADTRCGKRTFATLIGERATRAEYIALVVLAYAAIAAGVVFRGLPPLALGGLLTAPAAASLCRRIGRDADPVALTDALRGTARLHQRTGWLIAAALLVSGPR
ncbi:MAG TPA: 1,4-dihydroxy-2-naphthoate octaprenyltransferase [bacterium]|nr:1,4-dihydroxy-2-naphthoate octaprenyltransferase [bacterium]